MVGSPDMSSYWRIIGESVIGHSHIRKKLPNQDQGGYKRNHGGYPIISAVADGHGGKIYFRSDRGSNLAINSATKVISYYHDQDPSLSGSKITEAICRDILKEWKSSVFSDIDNNPYSTEELSLIEEGKAGRKVNIPIDPDYDLIRPYGSTVLATIITNEYVSFFQLGDGDIIIHTKDGAFTRPIPLDKNLSGNETYSLCMPESWRDFKVVRVNEIPDFIMLCTDGYANSFADESGFSAAARDIYSYIFSADTFETGVEQVRVNLRGWLSLASEKGSGDDITALLLAYNPVAGSPKPRNLSDDDLFLLNQISSRPLSYDFLKMEKTEPIVTQKLAKTDQKSGISSTPASTPIIKSVPPSRKVEGIKSKPGVSLQPKKRGFKISIKIVFFLLFLVIIGMVVVYFALLGMPGTTSKEVTNSSQSSELNIQNYSGKAPFVVRFNNTTTYLTNISERIWDFGDGTNITANMSDPYGQTPEYTYQHPGSYSATLIERNDTRNKTLQVGFVVVE